MAQNLNIREGICINLGNCPKADTKEIQKINLGDEFICTNNECGNDLQPYDPPPPNPLKKILLIAGALIILGGGGFGVWLLLKPKPVPPASISLDQSVLPFEKAGKTAQLTATVQPDNATDKSVTWSSSNEGVAKVENGKVTAVAEGNAEITASTGNGVSAICEVTVGTPPPPQDICKICRKKLSECICPPPPIPGPITFPQGKYTGGSKYSNDLKKKIPEGDGTMTYTRRVQIAKHDTQNPAHYAEAGDKFVGSWGNGDIVSGVLYDKNGVIKEKIFAPKRFNPYDISKDCN